MKKGWKVIPIGGIIENVASLDKNKTGAWRKLKPEIDHNACIGCQRCVMNCPERVIDYSQKKIAIDYDYCKGCGICENVCPKKAIKMQ